MCIFLTWESFCLIYRACSVCLFPVNKTNNGFSAANFRILLTNPMTSFCSNLLHLSLKITFSSCNRLIIPYFSLLISSLSSVLTELIELVIFCSKFARASWKSPFLVLVLYLYDEKINQIEQSIIEKKYSYNSKHWY